MTSVNKDKELRSSANYRFQRIFNVVQQQHAMPEKYNKLLNELAGEISEEEFITMFIKNTRIALHSDKKKHGVHVVALFKFLAQFVTNRNDSLLDHVLDLLLSVHNLDSESIRYHCCLFIKEILEYAGPSDISDYLDDIIDCLCERMNDAQASVRLEAVSAAFYLQDPDNNNNKVIGQLSVHFLDPKDTVRQVVVQKICLVPSVMEDFIARTRDVSSAVRKEVYKRLLTIPVRVLKISQRQQVVIQGLGDSKEDVKKQAEELVITWAKSYDNYIQFVDALLLDASIKVAETSERVALDVIEALLRNVPRTEFLNQLPLKENTHLVPFKKLTWGSAIYWKKMLEDAVENEIDIVPEMMLMCNYVEG